MPGKNGTDGVDGEDGVSVFSASLPAGDSDCPEGGSRFTAASGTTFACNGAPGASGGVAGQDASSSVGSGDLAINPTLLGPFQIPGLVTTITVPSGSFGFISSTGGALIDSDDASGFSLFTIVVRVDGTTVGVQLMSCRNNAAGVKNGSDHWSIAKSVPLTPGSHTISVLAMGLGFGAGTQATVSGPANSPFQGTLDVLTFKR